MPSSAAQPRRSPGSLILGAHMPTAGGLYRAIERGLSLRCDAVQIFTRNQLRWKAPPLDEEAVARFRGIAPRLARVFSHGSYLANLASPDDDAWDRSWRALADELDRAEVLGLPVLVMHPGSHRGSGARAGIKRVARALARADRAARPSSVRVLFESTAGGGNVLGGRLEELRDILEATERRPGGVGVCLDTCHLFAAGYDLRDEDTFARTMEEVERLVGIRSVGAVHLNDSHGDLGSHMDRHAHIGKGRIGRAGFRFLLADRRFRGIPLCLETPKGKDLSEDRMNLALLRRLAPRDRRRGS